MTKAEQEVRSKQKGVKKKRAWAVLLFTNDQQLATLHAYHARFAIVHSIGYAHMLKDKIQALKDKFGGALLSGSVIMLVSTTVVNAGNYLYNLILGRWLGPADFSDLSLIVTLMLMVTFVTVTLQMTAAKFAAAYSADDADNSEQMGIALRRWLNKWAWRLGIGIGLLLALGAPVWQSFFRTASPWPFVILGVGIPVYFVQGIDRGVLQGEIQFNKLALSYQAEMWARLGAGLLLVALGFSVGGATVGITLSFVATWLVARAALKKDNAEESTATLDDTQKQAVKAFAWPVIIANVSQILINNSDILIVKRFFEAEEAGRYAALALIGRIVFFATWSVVVTLFPIVAQRHQKGETHRQLLWAGLGMVAAASLVIVAFTVFIPEWIVNILFGQEYLTIAPLLWLYTIATMLYSLANVVINYRLSADETFGTTIAVVGGLAQVIGLWLFHATLRQVVITQIIIMSGLLIALLIWDSWLTVRQVANISGDHKTTINYGNQELT